MRISLYQVDAFTGSLFKGNPAAVCPLREWLDDGLLQNVAAENNLPATAFFVPEKEGYRIRWFTASAELDLCGHGTLAAAFVVFRYFDPSARQIDFQSRSGLLTVGREEEMVVLDFPARPPVPCPAPGRLAEALGREPVETLCADDYIAVLGTEEEVAELSPSIPLLGTLDRRAVVVTARGGSADFVSRCFAPRLGVDEDQVTGSAHCELVPYWSEVLAKNALRARQLSARGGELFCRARGGRVLIAGRAVLYLEGTIQV
jgi:PhzF family phenazine biosynthesis protein